MASFFSMPTTVPLSLSLMLAFLLIPSSEGRDYLVGGAENAWTLPRPSPDYLSHWAHRRHFRVGDALLWKYDHKTESVLEVKEEDYKSCNVANPISKYNDGETKVELKRGGSFYFISGADGHCQQGLRLDLVVRSDQHGGHGSPSPSPSPAAAPSPSPTPTPAPAPAKNGAAALGSAGFLGLVMGMGVTLVMMMI
ncbi:early nodulin-55-2-like [Prosopis cineraria]|uniref:early nodulin-55-2-like n=1 Tax=Prosopis cineraria TaxID=364024 RepID=UPI00240ECD1E|nr:early nodulin-55-2-like [Prosopis cineraria]